MKDIRALTYLPANFNIAEYRVVFPSGKKITISWSTPYITHKEEEHDFLSRLSSLRSTTPDYPAFRTYISDYLSEIDPDVANKSLTDEEARRMSWRDIDDEELAKKLKANGWIAYKKKK